MKLNKYENNPILSPNPDNSWESLSVCNPGVFYEDGKFYMLYRAAGHDPEHIIRIGMAESDDGIHFHRVSDQPVIEPCQDSFDAGGCEDPRIVKMDGEFYITYAFRPYYPGQYWTFDYDEVRVPVDHGVSAPKCLKENIANTALAVSKDLKEFKKVGRITDPNLDDRDVILFPERIHGKYWMIHRPKQWAGKSFQNEKASIWIRSSDDVFRWNGSSKLLMKGEEDWELKIGGNAPPVKTQDGWLMIYHGVDKANTYRLGAALLDLEDPAKVIYRTRSFIAEPETREEFEGLYKWGCIFPCGNVLLDDTLYIYYGASDTYISLATCNINELISFIKSDSRIMKGVYVRL